MQTRLNPWNSTVRVLSAPVPALSRVGTPGCFSRSQSTARVSERR
jgi:hypothetical protein